MACDGIRTVFPIRRKSQIRSARTFFGYDSGNETHNTNTPPTIPQGSVTGRYTCDGVEYYSSVSFAGKRFAQPAYGVPSGPFSSTCQNDTSSGNTQKKLLGVNCKPLAAVYRGANGCCALTYLRMAILQSRDADSWNMIGPVRMLMITMSITDYVGKNGGLCLHNLSTFDMNYW